MEKTKFTVQASPPRGICQIEMRARFRRFENARMQIYPRCIRLSILSVLEVPSKYISDRPARLSFSTYSS